MKCPSMILLCFRERWGGGTAGQDSKGLPLYSLGHSEKFGRPTRLELYFRPPTTPHP